MSDEAAPCRLVIATALQPGAIATLHLLGEVEPVLHAITGRPAPPVGVIRLANLADVDRGLVARLDGRSAQLMPHGGPRVVQRIVQAIVDAGAVVVRPDTIDPRDLYPEAADDIEAMTLSALARAASPLAIDVLLDQPNRWRSLQSFTDDDAARSRRLNRLIDPPLVVLAGPANVGKSTLSNALLGRSMSIALDEPGTTRDYTTGLIDLGGLVVRWHDTPGLRETEDPIEQQAIALARRLMNQADLLIAITDAGHDWPDLPRRPDLFVGAKTDLATRADAAINVSAITGDGIAGLVTTVRDVLVPPADLAHPGPWRFDDRLVAGAPIT